MTDMPSLAENVARLACETYEALQPTGKPAIRSNGIAEWTILAGIVVQRQGTDNCDLTKIRFIAALFEHRDGCKVLAT
jgi:hypothetical protein